MMYTLLKYVSRMSSRCTPFGLFSGTSVGQFASKTCIERNPITENKRHTRLDMNYLVALAQDLSKDKHTRNQLLFYPNSSIYEAGNYFRYVEYSYINSQRIHRVVAIEKDEYLTKILDKAQHGALLSDLSTTLVSDEITLDEAYGFLIELLENQVLVSELEPSISGPEFLNQILPVLRKTKSAENLITNIETTISLIDNLDKQLGNKVEKYLDISQHIKKINTSFELKYLFQTDLQITTKTNQLSDDIIQKVKKGIQLLNKLTEVPEETLLSKFSKAFFDRYETREIPLAKALDIELGIGFLQNRKSGDISPLIDDLILPYKKDKETSRNINWSPVHTVLHKKLIATLQDQKQVMTLTDEDFEQLPSDTKSLPDTISTMIELIHTGTQEKIIMSSAGGSSAANLLGRFCHGDNTLSQFVQEITDTETHMNPNQVLAEIIHLPESRVGNILMRPSFRAYEIPYLAKSTVPTEHQITLDDMMLSSTNGKTIKLRSKKLQKEIIPRLTNAHNYSNNALPIYQFLAHMQTQHVKSGVGFSWGPLAENYDFLPRVEYDSIIFSCAIWNIKTKDLKQLFDCFENTSELLNRWQHYCTKNKIPQYALLVEGDNELLINTKNITSVKMFLTTIKKKPGCKLKEFLHNKSVVQQDNQTYTNQIILSFYNQEKYKNIPKS